MQTIQETILNKQKSTHNQLSSEYYLDKLTSTNPSNKQYNLQIQEEDGILYITFPDNPNNYRRLILHDMNFEGLDGIKQIIFKGSAYKEVRISCEGLDGIEFSKDSASIITINPRMEKPIKL
jgi:hypothetical protein